MCTPPATPYPGMDHHFISHAGSQPRTCMPNQARGACQGGSEGKPAQDRRRPLPTTHSLSATFDSYCLIVVVMVTLPLLVVVLLTQKLLMSSAQKS